MIEQLANFLATTVVNMPGDMDSSETVLTVASDSTFPSAYPYRLRIDDELMKVTGTPGANQLTVVRGDGGTTGAIHLDSATVRVVLTKESLDALMSVQLNGSETSNRRVINFSSDFSVADNSGSGRVDVGIAVKHRKICSGTFTWTASGNTHSENISLSSFSLTQNMADMMIHVRLMQPNNSGTTTIDGDPNYTSGECWAVGEAAFGRTDLAATGVPDTLRIHTCKILSVGASGYRINGYWALYGST